VLAFLQRRLRGLHVVRRLLERFTRGELPGPQVLLTLECLLRLFELHASGLDRLTALIERHLRGLQRGGAAVHARAQ
jgi:hypothetical protein